MRTFQFKSLQARTFSTLVPLVLLTLILISFLSYFFAKQKLDAEISQNATHSLSGVKADIAANVDRHALLVSMLVPRVQNSWGQERKLKIMVICMNKSWH